MKKALLAIGLLSCTLAGAQPPHKTVKEFMKLSTADTTSYVLTGVVSKVRSSSSGSFFLQDATGTVLIYGIQEPGSPGKSFKQMDIVKGDTLSVLGRFTIYNGTTIEMKDGRLLSRVDGPDHNLSFMDRLEKKPVFKGKEGGEAEEAFRQWVQARVKNPDGTHGRVYVRFVVGRKGDVQEVQIQKGASQALNEEALRVVRSSPKWKPARMDGAPTRVTYVIPVEF